MTHKSSQTHPIIPVAIPQNKRVLTAVLTHERSPCSVLGLQPPLWRVFWALMSPVGARTCMFPKAATNSKSIEKGGRGSAAPSSCPARVCSTHTGHFEPSECERPAQQIPSCSCSFHPPTPTGSLELFKTVAQQARTIPDVFPSCNVQLHDAFHNYHTELGPTSPRTVPTSRQCLSPSRSHSDASQHSTHKIA